LSELKPLRKEFEKWKHLSLLHKYLLSTNILQ
jgi:hypothetical protein